MTDAAVPSALEGLHARSDHVAIGGADPHTVETRGADD